MIYFVGIVLFVLWLVILGMAAAIVMRFNEKD